MIGKLFAWLYNKLALFNNPYFFVGIPKSDYIIENKKIFLPKLALSFGINDSNVILAGYPHAIKIVSATNAKFRIEGKNVFVVINDLNFKINSAEELFILYEVFVAETYRYHCLRDSVFVDIGMNSGITSLYYAQNPLICSVYSYELFKPTFLLGMENLKLNSVSKKIQAFNYGLSNKSFRSKLKYSLNKKGRMGLNGLPLDEKFYDVSEEEVEVRDVSLILENIASASNDLDLIVKMDCEGEELNLIRRLYETGLLAKISVLLIEYHYILPNEIEELLGTFNFHVFSNAFSTMDSGMIYAGKKL